MNINESWKIDGDWTWFRTIEDVVKQDEDLFGSVRVEPHPVSIHCHYRLGTYWNAIEYKSEEGFENKITNSYEKRINGDRYMEENTSANEELESLKLRRMHMMEEIEEGQR